MLGLLIEARFQYRLILAGCFSSVDKS